MVVFFMFLIIIFVISLFFLLLCLSNFEIEINDFHFDSKNKKHHKLEKYLIYIRLKLFNKLTWLKIKINKKKMKAIENSKVFKSKIFHKINEYEHIRDTILKNKEEILRKDNLEYIKQISIDLKKLDLDLNICTSDAIITSYVVAIFASIISILLAKKNKRFKCDKYRYVITPKYEQKPSIIIKLNCIISIKIVHIMNVIYMLKKKRSVMCNERTSNRRSYVCSND